MFEKNPRSTGPVFESMTGTHLKTCRPLPLSEIGQWNPDVNRRFFEVITMFCFADFERLQRKPIKCHTSAWPRFWAYDVAHLVPHHQRCIRCLELTMIVRRIQVVPAHLIEGLLACYPAVMWSYNNAISEHPKKPDVKGQSGFLIN